MLKNSYKNLFFFMLISGTILAVSSSSWFAIWMGLEINLLSIIPLMMDTKNLYSSEATLKYFLTQALASSILLFSIILSFIIFKIENIYTEYSIYNEIINLMIISSLMLKSGAAPFHFWFPNVMEGISWFNNMILMTWQKIAPLMLMSYCLNINFLLISVILSSFFGSIGGLNQMSLRKLMAFSSINHLSWMMVGLMKSESLWQTYFLFYCFLSLTMVFLFNSFKIFYLNQMFTKFNSSNSMKFITLIPLLSLGGLPPFLGFFPKWMIIEHLVFMNSFFILFLLMMFTLITLFFYLRICYSSFLLSSQENSWKWFKMNNNKFFNVYLFTTFFSCFGFILINLMFFLL